MNKTKLLFFLTLIVTILILSIPCAYSMNYENSRNSMKGWKGVHVVVEKLEPEIEKVGLKQEQIRTDVELKLRLAGIKVLSEEESYTELGVPFLYVKTGVLRLSDSSFAYTITLAVGARLILPIKLL